MPAGFAVKLKVSKKGPERLRRQSRDAGNLAPALRLFGAHMLGSTAQNFSQAGRRDGATGVWPGLSDFTIQLRRTGDGEALPELTPKPLDDTGRLKSSITFRETARTLEVGTNVPYAADHQQSGAFGSKKAIVETLTIPSRLREAAEIPQHSRTTKSGKVVSVKAHTQRAHVVRSYSITRRYGLPARPFLHFHRSDLDHARRILAAYIDGGLPGAVAAAAGAVGGEGQDE